MMETIQHELMRACLMGLAASLAVIALRSSLVRDAISRLTLLWRCMTRFGRAAVCSFLLVGILVGGDKTNNVNNLPPQMMQGGGSFETGFTGLTGLSAALLYPPSSPNPVNLVNPVQNQSPVQTTIEDIARGYRQVCVTTNENVSYTMPTDAVIVGNWHKRGTFSEWMRLDLGGFAFPLGTNETAYSAFSVFNDGKIRPTPRDDAHEICAIGVPMLAMQGESRFWVAECDDGSKLLTWENLFLNADTNTPVNAQIQLYPNGGFATRSNDVETVYERINPHDWDGDGKENGTDANPTVCDGDFFGPTNVLPEGANTNAYCTVSLVATGPDTYVMFEGDRPSNYPDPRFIAKHGVTNEVVILMGKTYSVSSDWPIEFVGASDSETEVRRQRSSTSQFQVVRPVLISASAGNPFTMSVMPSNLCGEFEWHRSDCGCSVVNFGVFYALLCTGDCPCGGVSPYGQYWYEGYFLPVWGNECSCGHESTGDAISVSLDWPSVVDVTRSGESAAIATLDFSSTVPTNGVLSLLWAANGRLFVGKGQDGLDEADQIERIGVTNCTSQSCSYRLTGLCESDDYNKGVVGVMWEDDNGKRTLLSKNFTVVERNAKPITDELTQLASPFAVVNPSCATSNDVVYLSVSVEPLQFPDERIVWRCKTGFAVFPEGDRGRCVKARVGAETTVFAIQVGDCPSPELELTVKVWPSE